MLDCFIVDIILSDIIFPKAQINMILKIYIMVFD